MKAGDAGSAFVAGKVDAAVTWEPWLSKAKETPFGHVLLSSDKTPGIIVDSLAFKPDFLKKRGADVKKIVAAWNEAVEFRGQKSAGSRRHHGQIHRAKTRRVHQGKDGRPVLRGEGK